MTYLEVVIDDDDDTRQMKFIC